MTFGDLWTLIQRNRISPDLHVVHHTGRFGLSDRYVSICDKGEQIINVPMGDIPTDKNVFVWDDNYSRLKDKIREACPPAGKVLMILLKAGVIKKDKRVQALIDLCQHPEQIQVYNEKSESLILAESKEELMRQIDLRVRRQHGLVG